MTIWDCILKGNSVPAFIEYLDGGKTLQILGHPTLCHQQSQWHPTCFSIFWAHPFLQVSTYMTEYVQKEIRRVKGGWPSFSRQTLWWIWPTFLGGFDLYKSIIPSKSSTKTISMPFLGGGYTTRKNTLEFLENTQDVDLSQPKIDFRSPQKRKMAMKNILTPQTLKELKLFRRPDPHFNLLLPPF